MKSASIFALGLILGVALTFSIYRQGRSPSPPIARASAQATNINYRAWNPADRQNRAINYHESTFVTTQSGQEYQLMIFGSMGTPLRYRWTSTSRSGEEGEGDLLEKYEVVAKKLDGDEVRDAGGSTVIMIAEHHLEWSVKDQSSGWIYFDAAELTLSNESANKARLDNPLPRTESEIEP